MNIYLAGCGKLGVLLGEKLSHHNIIGLRRSRDNGDFPVIQIDLSNQSECEQLPCDADIIVFTVTPNQFDENSYQQVYETILGNVIDWANRHETSPLVLLVSSTGVYGQQNGEWVDENSPTEPTAFSGRWVLSGEQLLQSKIDDSLIVRFSGIYGAGRTRLITKALSNDATQKNPALWTNRIHEHDCIGVLAFLIERYVNNQALEHVYLASDDMPVSQYDVINFIRQQRNQPNALEKIDDLSEQCNKRCDNTRIKSLGYQFIYPDYKAGYAELMRNYT